MSDAVLAIRLRALGDVVLTTPALRALVRGHIGPIDVVTDARYVALVDGLPGIDRVIGVGRGRTAMLETVAMIRRRHYGATVDFFGNPRSAVLTAMSGALVTWGYDVRGRRYAYRRRVPRDLPVTDAPREYAAASHVRLACAAGGVDDGVATGVAIADGARERAGALLAEAGVADPARTLGLVAAGTWATKTWPASHAAAFARRLVSAGREVLLLAGPGEEPVTRAMRALAPAVRVLPSCDVAALVAVIERLEGVVGTDSGPRHVAVALGRPTFAWFGPTHPDNWTPRDPAHATWRTDVPCRGCNLTACPHWVCLPGLVPERAATLALRHFDARLHAAADLGPAARA